MSLKEILIGDEKTIKKRYDLATSETYTMGQVIGLSLVFVITIIGWVTNAIWVALGINYFIGFSIVRFNL